MSHTVGEKAAIAVRNSERKQILETRSPDEIIKGIRGNLAAKLAVTPGDTKFLLEAYDKLAAEKVKQIAALSSELAGISDQLSELQHVPPPKVTYVAG